MASLSRRREPRASFWLSRNGLSLAIAAISSAVAWWMIAWPVVILRNQADHDGHFLLTFAHMIGGTGMLFLGALNLYLASRKDRYPMHRWIGRLYLLIGTFGSLTALAITLSPAHKSAGSPLFTNATISLTMLALVWLAAAGAGWRAVRNKRFEIHRDWMIRSYILVWSFVFCRIASRVSNLEHIGNGEAFIWLSWVGPLLIGEFILQWPNGSRRLRSPT